MTRGHKPRRLHDRVWALLWGMGIVLTLGALFQGFYTWALYLGLICIMVAIVWAVLEVAQTRQRAGRS